MKAHTGHSHAKHTAPVHYEELGILDGFKESDLVLATLFAPKGVELYLNLGENGASSVDEVPDGNVYRKGNGQIDTTGFQYIRYMRIPGDYKTEEKLTNELGETLPIEGALIVTEAEPMSVYVGKVVGNKIIPTKIKVESLLNRTVKDIIGGVSGKALAIHFN